MNKRFAKTLVGAAALALVGSAAIAAGPFEQFGGEWRGAGRVTDKDGKSEPLRCRSTDAPSQDGIAMNMSLVCASDTYRIDLRANVYTDGQNLRGSWQETTRGVSGDLQGEIQPNLINVSAGNNAHIVVRVGKGRLDVSLDAPGTSISRVSMSMKRS